MLHNTQDLFRAKTHTAWGHTNSYCAKLSEYANYLTARRSARRKKLGVGRFLFALVAVGEN